MKKFQLNFCGLLKLKNIMDLCFGEVIVDPISRAFIDDYDDESFNKFCRPEIKWQINPSDQKEQPDVNHFILIEGVNAHKLLKDTVLRDKNIQHICSIRNVKLYEMDKATILCVAEEHDLNYFATITDLIEKWIKGAKEVSLVSLQRLSDFKSDVLPDDCIVRAVNSKFDDIENLNAPNFITGLAAGISTKRLIFDSTFSCYAVYVDLFDEISIKRILGLLKRLDLTYDETINIKAMHQKSYLYM